MREQVSENKEIFGRATSKKNKKKKYSQELIEIFMVLLSFPTET